MQGDAYVVCNNLAWKPAKVADQSEKGSGIRQYKELLAFTDWCVHFPVPSPAKCTWRMPAAIKSNRGEV